MYICMYVCICICIPFNVVLIMFLQLFSFIFDDFQVHIDFINVGAFKHGIVIAVDIEGK